MSLLENDIARELGVSRTPVREALLRLKCEGLVKMTGKPWKIAGAEPLEYG